METCYNCQKQFSRISVHYARSDCGYPTVPDKLKQRTIGELAGDGGLGKVWQSGNCRFKVSMAGESGLAYLQDLHRAFGRFSSCAPEIVRDDYHGSGNAKEYYQWYTKTHPFFTKLADKWYKERGGKQFPRGLKVTPRFLKAWYCGDGTLRHDYEPGMPSIKISAASEYANPALLINMFEETEFDPKISRGVDSRGVEWSDVLFSTDQTERVLRYMGKPAPGYGYKWEHPNLSKSEQTEVPFC